MASPVYPPDFEITGGPAPAGPPLVSHLQRYSIHDGDGIRTTVFFKGCPLSCAWCHNPEGQSYAPELFVHAERCTACGRCADLCRKGAVRMEAGRAVRNRSVCDACGGCVRACPANARELAGRAYSLPELFRELAKDERFYEQSGGGVTLSGGEVLAQDSDYVSGLLRLVKRAGWGTAVDTCGAVPWDRFERVLPWTDLFLYDLKLMDGEAHQRYTGRGNARVLENLRRLSKAGGRIDIRIPVVGGVNDNDENMEAAAAFLREHVRVRRVCLLPYHGTGAGKYAKLGLEYHGSAFTRPSEERLAQLLEPFRRAGFRAQTGG